MRIDMHDYTPQAKAYWWLTALLGAVVIAASVANLAQLPALVLFQVLFGAAFAALAGVFAVRIPGTKISSGAAELFMFLLLLEVGPAGAALGAAAEAGAISARTSKRWTSRIGSPAMAALAMYACGNAFEFVKAHVAADPAHADQVKFVLLPLLALSYFAVDSLLLEALIKLKASAPLDMARTLREHGWLGLVYAASASIAGLLETAFSGLSVSALFAAGPVIAVFISMLHVYFKRLEDRERLQAERLAHAENAATEATRHLAELKESEDRFQSAFSHAAVGMVLVSGEGRVLQANAALARLLGRPEHELGELALTDLLHPGDAPTIRADLAALLNGTEDAFVSELRCRHRSGADVWVSISGSHFAVKPPLSRCITLQLQDISARRRAESRLHHIANYDGLTDLANRTCFTEQLTRSIAALVKHPDRRYAVLFLDFDRFKLINDSLGHGAGDALLQGLAQRLVGLVGATDLVARFGGDEFAILMHHVSPDQEAVRLARRVQEVIAEPIYVNGIAISTKVSIGITTCTFGYDSPEQVIRDADTAMYRAKNQGRDRFVAFDSALHAEVTRRLWLEGELRNAVAHGDLVLWYQPIVDLETRSLVGFEALTRWFHRADGPIAPDCFIRIAEETGLIVPLGTWALRAACQALGRWRAENATLGGLSVHVNVSGVQLAQPDFPLLVRSAVADAGIEPRQLIIELTESVLIETRSVAIPHLQELREFGVGVSIDDFGTGYSSFSMLHTLPIDEIKIDKSFIDPLGRSERAAAVTATMLALGRTLGTTMVAEGIETEEQFARLVAMGCSSGQGYLLGRPVAEDGAVAFAVAQRTDANAARDATASKRSEASASASAGPPKLRLLPALDHAPVTHPAERIA